MNTLPESKYVVRLGPARTRQKKKTLPPTNTPRPALPVQSSCAIRLQDIPPYAGQINSSPHAAQKEKEKKKKRKKKFSALSLFAAEHSYARQSDMICANQV